MRKLLSLSLLCAAFLFGTFQVNAEVKVIVHPLNMIDMDQNAISRIFMGKSSTFPQGGAEAKPFNLEAESPVTAEFNEKVLNKSNAQLKSYWSKLVFTGKGTPPEEVSSEQELIDLVKSNPSAIGYVSGSANLDGVRVVGTF